MTMITVCSEYLDGLKRFAATALARCGEAAAKLDAIRARQSEASSSRASQAEASSSPTTASALDRVDATMATALRSAQARTNAIEAAEFRAVITRLAKELDDAFVPPIAAETPVRQDRTTAIKVLRAFDQFLVTAMPLIADDAISPEAEKNLALGQLPARRVLRRIATGFDDVNRGVDPEIFKREKKRAAEPSYLWERRADVCVAIEVVHRLDGTSPIEAATHVIVHHPQVQRLVGPRGGKHGRSAGPMSDEELTGIILGWRERLNTQKRVPAHAAERYREGIKDFLALGLKGGGLALADQYLSQVLMQQVPEGRE